MREERLGTRNLGRNKGSKEIRRTKVTRNIPTYFKEKTRGVGIGVGTF